LAALLLLAASSSQPTWAHGSAAAAAPTASTPSSSPRLTLAVAPQSGPRKLAVDQFKQADPTASFTWLRGHVDAFTALPKSSVPAYAKPILQRHGLPTGAVAQPKDATTTAPKSSEGRGTAPREELDGRNIGFAGASDPRGNTTGVPAHTDTRTPQLPTGYAQAGEPAVKEILTAFLSQNNNVFALDANLLAEQLPNLRLVKYGVGKHFRRAQFEQSVGGVPILDGKTVVLFDLNWNVVGISRQLETAQKLGIGTAPGSDPAAANRAAIAALKTQLGKDEGTLRVAASRLGIDVVRGLHAWQVDVLDTQAREEFTVKINPASNEVLNISDNTALYTDAQVRRWDYGAGNMDSAGRVNDSGIYTHDDNTLVHDFFYVVNDDRNDGGTGNCSATSPDSGSTPAAYGTTTSATYIRPTRRSDRDFTLWEPSSVEGSFGESHVYYWAREYMQWQKQALVDLGVLTLGNFNNYIKALIVVNACDATAGRFTSSFPVSTQGSVGENLGTIILPERCRSGNPNCSNNDYADAGSGDLYTFEGSGGYHFPGVIHHELNHFVLIKYFGVANSLDCAARNEQKYFQEGGLGRTLPQMFWHHYYNVGYLPDTTNKLFRSNGTSGKVHNPANAATLNNVGNFACGDGTADPYSWGGVLTQPMWEIYHGEKVSGAVRSPMARPAEDKGMIKSMYFAADMASASSFPDRFELANRFMEFWELFSTAQPTTKTDWCEAWEHHGMKTFINVNFCS
jgi:hypothetical protein